MSFISLFICIFVALPILVAVLFARKLQKNAEYFKKKKIPYIGAGLGRSLRMIVGSINLVQAEDELYRDTLKTNSPIVGYCDRVGKKNFIVNDPELIKNILIKDYDHFLNRRQVLTKHSNKYMKKMLSSMEGEQWRTTRAKLNQIFTGSKIKRMFQIFANSSRRMELYLMEYINYPNQTSCDFDFTKIVSKYALDVLAGFAFGINSNSFEVPPNHLSPFEKMAQKFWFAFSPKFFLKLLLVSTAPRLAGFLKVDITDREAQNYISNVVQNELQKRRQTGERRDDFLQFMMDLQDGFDDDDIIANGMNFLTAGFDTTQSLMLLTLYTLALETEVQEKLHNEIITVLQNYEGNVTYDAIAEMPYLDMFIQETLRFYAPVTKTERVCSKDYKVPGTDFLIEKGDFVMFPIRGIHKDSRYYPNPEKFIPERFSADNKAKTSVYTFLPFGHGPRNCIGMRFAIIKVKTVIAQLVKIFKIAPCSKTENPMQFSKNIVVNQKEACG